jgi:hypothetical protein
MLVLHLTLLLLTNFFQFLIAPVPVGCPGSVRELKNEWSGGSRVKVKSDPLVSAG